MLREVFNQGLHHEAQCRGPRGMLRNGPAAGTPSHTNAQLRLSFEFAYRYVMNYHKALCLKHQSILYALHVATASAQAIIASSRMAYAGL